MIGPLKSACTTSLTRKCHFPFQAWLLLILPFLLIATIIMASSVGPITVPLGHTFSILLDQLNLPAKPVFTEQERMVIADVRLPRVLVGAVAGAALGISGAAMQGLFRNPLVEPGYVGVSSGAALGAVCSLYFGWNYLGKWTLPGTAFIGALLTVLIVYLIWRSSKKLTIATLLLLGIGINSFLSALISVMIASSANEQELRSIVYWMQGGLEARTWEHVQMVSPIILLVCFLLCLFGRDLNGILLGEDQAQSSGIHVNRTRYIVLGLTSLATGAAVAVSGIISFVGLVVPHIIRLVVGPDHRYLLPLSAFGGAIFLVLADVASRMMLQPVTLQVGVVCSFIGAPLFLILILKKKKGGAL